MPNSSFYIFNTIIFMRYVLTVTVGILDYNKYFYTFAEGKYTNINFLT